MRRFTVWLCVTAFLLIASAQDATEKKFTPRELFYQPAAAVSKKQDTKKGGTAPAQGPALGLKYTIRKRTPEGILEVSEKTVFHTGDAIELRIETNSAGYLYIIHRGSSGAWSPMFPSPAIARGDNHVESRRAYDLPPRMMIFKKPTGIESISIVFSRKAVDDLDSLIYALQKGNPATARKELVADARIDDVTVNGLRKTYSRDLIIEPITAAAETATYVVNPSGSPDSRMLWEIQLTHQ